MQYKPREEVNPYDISLLNHLQHSSHARVPCRCDPQRAHQCHRGDVRANTAGRQPVVPPRLLHIHAHVRDARHSVPAARCSQPATVSRGQAVTEHRR